MKQRNRAAILKLLVFSLLFLQVSLAFHTHASEESVHCDACVTAHSADHDEQTSEECWAGIFFHAALASDAITASALPADLFSFYQEACCTDRIIQSSLALPLGSRAPPIL